MAGYFKTIEDLERATYGASGNDQLLKATTGIHSIHDGAQTLGNQGLYNLVYGQKVWSMINREINALSMLPKKPWNASGWRILKGRSVGGNNDTFSVADLDTLGGQAENATISSITEVQPTYEILHVSPKTIAHTYEVSEIAQLMGGLDDGIGDILAAYREEVGVSHAESLNKMILQDLTSVAGTGVDAHATKADKTLLSLYRIVSTHAEMNALGTLTNKLKLYGQTRASSGTEYLEAYVDSNSGTDRNLTVNLLNTALRNLMARGGEPKVILTGYDTIQSLGELLQAQERFMGRAEVVPSHNGIKGVKGREIGFKVATYHDIPIIPVKDMPNGGAGLSDMLILDTDHLFLCTMKPTEYFEAGMHTGEVFGHGKLGHRGIYRTIAETMCTYFRGQGKIIDLV